MSSLKDRLQSDLTTAMKSRDELRTATLRMALTAVRMEEVSGTSARELADDEVVPCWREVKKRREAAEAFDGGRAPGPRRPGARRGRGAGRVPTGAGLHDDLRDIVAAAIAETGADGPRGIGAVGRAVSPQTAGAPTAVG